MTEVTRWDGATCPNCNADAQQTCERRKPTGVLWELYIVCPKCKGKYPIGLMHDEEKRLIDLRRKLNRKWETAKTPAARGAIVAELKRLEQREKEWNLSL